MTAVDLHSVSGLCDNNVAETLKYENSLKNVNKLPP